MFKRIMLCAAVASTGLAFVDESRADHFVRGHVTRYGSYVQPHYRSQPDGNFYNNYSSWPNVNPYTGTTGTHHYPSFSYPSYSYPSYSPYHYTPYRSSLSFGF